MIKLIDSKEIESFFSLLKNRKIPHILLRNINNELPKKLKEGKDIDLLLKHENKEDILKLFNMKKMKYCHHSRTYLYGMDSFDYYYNKDIGFAVDVSYQLACQSPNDGEWVPLDMHLQRITWETRIITPELPWESILSPKMEIIHLVCRSIFDKKHFHQPYITRIEELKLICDINELSKEFQLIFFKFTPNLIEMLNRKLFENIPQLYLQFSDY